MTESCPAKTDTQLDSVVKAQLTSLDDTDCYASAWAEALRTAAESNTATVSWGGRGRGGRGLARRTVQPHDVVVENVRLEYVSDATPGLPGKVLLEEATLKLLSPKVYSLVGRNGCGKSTLLRRIHAGKIPGFPPHISTVYVPQEVVVPDPSMTPIQIVMSHHDAFSRQSAAASQGRIEQLEEQLEQLDLSCEDNSERVEDICQQISALEEEMDGSGRDLLDTVQKSLIFFGVDETCWHLPSEQLSGGQRKKILLACALVCQNCDLLLLDEPTNYLDVSGLLQLRRLIATCTKERNTTVLLVSHDVDLINDVATDVIHFFNERLMYYPGNYRDFVLYKHQQETHRLRQSHALEKQREAMLQTIENIKKQPVGRRGGDTRKKSRAIESWKKKLERHGIEKDEKGHRWTQQKAGTGIKEGSINSIDVSTRNKLSHTQLLKRAETSVAPVPDKAVQFVFRDTTCTWNEPLIMAMDVGHGYGVSLEHETEHASTGITKKEGMLFDCVDLCFVEGSTTCILGANGSGKSTLLRLLAKLEQPLEGKIHHAHNLNVGYFDQHVADDMIESVKEGGSPTTALSLLAERYPLKSEQDLRGELTSFGLNPKQASTNVKFLSGGERCRLCLAALMLGDPQALIMDEPTSHLDVESVEALVYGLKRWNGTLIMVSHDANFIRTLGGDCFVIIPEEGKVRRIPDGIDSYLNSFTL